MRVSCVHSQGAVRSGFTFLIIPRYGAVRCDLIEGKNYTVRCGSVKPHRTAVEKRPHHVKSCEKKEVEAVSITRIYRSDAVI